MGGYYEQRKILLKHCQKNIHFVELFSAVNMPIQPIVAQVQTKIYCATHCPII